METWGKIKFIGGDSRYHDDHQVDQEAQEHPPSTRMFYALLTLCVIYLWKPGVKYSPLVVTTGIMNTIKMIRKLFSKISQFVTVS